MDCKRARRGEPESWIPQPPLKVWFEGGTAVNPGAVFSFLEKVIQTKEDIRIRLGSQAMEPGGKLFSKQFEDVVRAETEGAMQMFILAMTAVDARLDMIDFRKEMYIRCMLLMDVPRVLGIHIPEETHPAIRTWIRGAFDVDTRAVFSDCIDEDGIPAELEKFIEDDVYGVVADPRFDASPLVIAVANAMPSMAELGSARTDSLWVALTKARSFFDPKKVTFQST